MKHQMRPGTSPVSSRVLGMPSTAGDDGQQEGDPIAHVQRRDCQIHCAWRVQGTTQRDPAVPVR